MACKHYAHTRKSKLDFLKISKSMLALVMAALIGFSSMYLLSDIIKVDAAKLDEGQTAFANVSQFQKYRWSQIQNKIFGTDPGTQANPRIYNPVEIMNNSVNSNNDFFNWVPDSMLSGVPVWDGSSETVNKQSATDDYDYDGDGTAEVKYAVYNVSNPAQFRYVLSNVETLSDAYIKVNLLSDLNMNGTNGKVWTPVETRFCTNIDFKKYLYIEGNGHTIYNLKVVNTESRNGAGLFSRPPAFMIAKNFGFRSSMILNAANNSQYHMVAGLLCAFAPQKFYFYNIHSSGGYFQVYTDDSVSQLDGGIGGLIGRKNMNPSAINFNSGIDFLKTDIGDCFMKNCSTDNCYMYGSDHVGGLTSWCGNQYVGNECRYDSEFPSVPEKYVLNQGFINSLTKSSTRDFIQSYNYYPTLFENCSSTDCEIFSTGHDSGAFISCGSGLKVKNCFTNNKIYARDNTGGFIGRIGNDVSVVTPYGVIHDDNDNCTFSSYFENCYSSGIVEGQEAMGGFIGLDNSARKRQTIHKSATDAQVLNGTGTASHASSAFVNCYSTAMVGMDYAGKYCGGFIGLDDNYNQGYVKNGEVVMPKITVDNVANGSKTLTGCGNFYVNCYAGGEVGNILTVIDIEDAKTKEAEYLKATDGLGEDNDNTSVILDYYPTGGFAGAVGIDGNLRNFTFNGTKINSIGNFYNCYYDMQTTAMHEMSVGFSNVQTYRDSGKNSDFNLTGVTGLYTEKSDSKLVPGLTGYPADYSSEGGKSFVMDSGGTSSSVWGYNNQYYPQLSVYMTTDTSLDNIQTAGISDVQSAKNSKFYIPVTTYETDKYHISIPVYSIADSDDSINAVKNKSNLSTTATYAAQLAQVVRAFRFSQASTSTVLLNHWDVTMDTNSGTVGSENDWKTDVPANKMTSHTVTDSLGYEYEEWYIDYTKLQAGVYDFKVTTPNWTYNYGSGGNNGGNLLLEVPEDDCDVRIRFYCSEPSSKDFYVKADIKRPSGAVEEVTLAEGEGYEVTPYTVAGNFPGIAEWTPTKNDLYTMKHTGDRENYTVTIKNLVAKDTPYYFKVTNGEGWTENWGVDGVAGGQENMSFTLTGNADVTITFNEKTHISTVTASPSANLTNVVTENKKIDFTGYSAIFSSPIFAGHYWFDKDADKVKEACEDGELLYNDRTGLYERVFNVEITNESQTNKNYAYKVVKDAIDKGANHSFSINSDVEVGTIIKVKVTYNPSTLESTIESVGSDAIRPRARVSSYSVIGAEGLTGHNWMSVEAARDGEMTPIVGSTTVFSKTYTNIEKGKYDFKIVADCMDGVWNSDDWGGPNNSNYVFELSEKANVEIIFDSVQEKIIVKSPALVRSKWVLTGVKTLMGDEIGEWNKTAPLMNYNPDTGLYEYSIKDVPVNTTKKEPEDQSEDTPNYNYACKVIQYNNDQNEDNILFVLKEGTQKAYDLKFEYDELYETLTIKAYNSKGEDVTSSVLSYSVTPYFYSILGSKNLTGDSWGTMFPAQAAYNGWMKDDDGDGVYTKSYKIQLPESGAVEQFSFKVAANGSFNSGLSWGNAKGENIIVGAASNTISETTLTIYFDSKTGQVTYKFADDVEYNGSNVVWYIAGTYKLRNNNGYKVSPMIYDTVRDITSGFTFTSGSDGCNQKGVLWNKDTLYNKEYNFKNSLTFDLNYNQFSNGKNNEINTKFISDIVQLDVEAIGDLNTANPAEELIAKFNCQNFIPGKQWLTVTTAGYGYSQAFNNWKKEYLRYAEYTKKKEFYEKQVDLHLSVMSGYKYLDDSGNTIVINDEATLLSYLYKYSGSEKDPAKELAIRFNLGDETLLTLKADLDNYADLVGKVPADKPDFGDTAIVGSRNIRLIPTAYLEAGNDARIEVRQPSADEEYDRIDNDQVMNSVKYYSDENAVSTVDGKEIDSKEFSYYNFAATAGYLITDRVGLGIYKNYNNQKITAYNSAAGANDYDYARDDLQTSYRNSNGSDTGRYFAMKSVFNNTGVFNKDTGKFDNQNNAGSGKYTDGGSRLGANLTVQNFKMQSSVGSSYMRDNDSAQTIVKIYKIVYKDGVAHRELVNTDSNPDSTSEPAIAYQKWTGQRNFVAMDSGDYVVQFFWTLSDGRYLQSEKEVKILVYEPNIGILNRPKYDGETHFERVYEDSGSSEQSPSVVKSVLKTDNTIKYQVTYSNQKISSDLTFAVLDVLPYDGNKRVYTDIDGIIDTDSYETNLSNEFNGFKLKNIKLTKSNSTTAIKGFYYTTSNDVQGWATNTSEKDVAKNLKLTSDSSYEGYIDKSLQKENNGIFESFQPLEGEIDYWREDVRTFGDGIDNVTAIALTGVKLGIRDSITIEFEVEYNGKADDLILNAANYHAFSRDMQMEDSGTVDQSTIVSTTVVTRNLEGYAWLDDNADGIVDQGEARLKNVGVRIYELVDGKRVPTSIEDTVTDQNGKYKFDNLPQGNYAVAFINPPSGTVTDSKGRTFTFNSLTVSPIHKEVDNVYDENGAVKADTLTGSRNLARDEANDGDNKVFGISKVSMPDNYSVGRSQYLRSDGTSLNYTQKANTFTYQKTNMNVGLMLDPARTLEGYAWYDVDRDGVLDIGEPRLQNIGVKIYKVENGNRTPLGVPDTVTDANGRYQFTGLSGGTYAIAYVKPPVGDITYSDGKVVEFEKLRISPSYTETDNVYDDSGNVKLDYVTGSKNLANVEKTDDTNMFVISQIVLPSDDNVLGSKYSADDKTSFNYIQEQYSLTYQKTNMNAGLIIPDPSRSLEGYAWNDINKDGIVDKDEPRIQNIGVKLYKIVDGNIVPAGVPDTVTDANGRYEFKGLDAGEYSIEYVKPSSGAVTLSTGKKVLFEKLIISPTLEEVDNVYNENGSIKPDYVTGSRNLAESSATNVYMIAQISLPDDDSIVESNYSADDKTNINYIQKTGTYAYQKTNMNVGFGYDEYRAAIDKVDQNDQPIAGIEFMLEYRENGKWYPVYYDDNGDIVYSSNPKTSSELDSENIKYTRTTDENGHLEFDKLFEAEYRFTEMTAPQGVGKLKSPIYFKLPYEVPEDKLAEYSEKYYVNVSENDSANDYKLVDGIRYYSYVKFKVIDPDYQFNLPQTGGFDGLFIILIVGFVLLGTGITLFILTKKKSKANCSRS